MRIGDVEGGRGREGKEARAEQRDSEADRRSGGTISAQKIDRHKHGSMHLPEARSARAARRLSIRAAGVAVICSTAQARPDALALPSRAQGQRRRTKSHHPSASVSLCVLSVRVLTCCCCSAVRRLLLRCAFEIRTAGGLSVSAQIRTSCSRLSRRGARASTQGEERETRGSRGVRGRISASLHHCDWRPLNWLLASLHRHPPPFFPDLVVAMVNPGAATVVSASPSDPITWDLQVAEFTEGHPEIVNSIVTGQRRASAGWLARWMMAREQQQLCRGVAR